MLRILNPQEINVKITFEGETIDDIIKQMDRMVDDLAAAVNTIPASPRKAPAPAPLTTAEIFEAPVDKPVDVPVEKPKRERTEKQKANDEKLRIAALAKKKTPEPVKAAPAAKKAAPKPPPPPIEEEDDEEEIDPKDLIALQTKTLEDLQTAYANGYQKEVFELLSRFGNGAKSFRELPSDAFPAIREAIDHGALT
jgi:hypothetical protein